MSLNTFDEVDQAVIDDCFCRYTGEEIKALISERDRLRHTIDYWQQRAFKLRAERDALKESLEPAFREGWWSLNIRVKSEIGNSFGKLLESWNGSKTAELVAMLDGQDNDDET